MDLEGRTRGFLAALDRFEPGPVLEFLAAGARMESTGLPAMDREGFGRYLATKQRNTAAGRHEIRNLLWRGRVTVAEWRRSAILVSGEPVGGVGVHVLRWSSTGLIEEGRIYEDAALTLRLSAGLPSGEQPPEHVAAPDLAFHPQETDYTCGPAALKMMLEAIWGIRVDEDSLALRMGSDERFGTRQRTLTAFVRSLGLAAHERHTDTSLADLRQLMHDGHLLMVCYWLPEEDTDHYALVLAAGPDTVVLQDPWHGPSTVLPASEFEARWHGDHRVATRRDRWLLAVRVPPQAATRADMA